MGDLMTAVLPTPSCLHGRNEHECGWCTGLYASDWFAAYATGPLPRRGVNIDGTQQGLQSAYEAFIPCTCPPCSFTTHGRAKVLSDKKAATHEAWKARTMQALAAPTPRLHNITLGERRIERAMNAMRALQSRKVRSTAGVLMLLERIGLPTRSDDLTGTGA